MPPRRRPQIAPRDATSGIRPSGPNADPRENYAAARRLRDAAHGNIEAAERPENAGNANLFNTAGMVMGRSAEIQQAEGDAADARAQGQFDALNLHEPRLATIKPLVRRRFPEIPVEGKIFKNHDDPAMAALIEKRIRKGRD